MKNYYLNMCATCGIKDWPAYLCVNALVKKRYDDTDEQGEVEYYIPDSDQLLWRLGGKPFTLSSLILDKQVTYSLYLKSEDGKGWRLSYHYDPRCCLLEAVMILEKGMCWDFEKAEWRNFNF